MNIQLTGNKTNVVGENRLLMDIKGYPDLLIVTGLEMRMCDQRDFLEASEEVLLYSEERETPRKQTFYWQPFHSPERNCLRIKLASWTEVWKMKRLLSPDDIIELLDLLNPKPTPTPFLSYVS